MEDAGLRISFPWQPDRSPAFLREREWLVTNGLGGYASGTLLGWATRKYHGLFVPNLPSPHGRTVVIPRLDEEIQMQDRGILLGGALYAGGQEEGHVHLYLKEFNHAWQSPTWIFQINDRVLEKTILMPFGQNTVYVVYRLLGGEPLQVRLRPFLAFRGHDESLPVSSYALWSVSFRGERFEARIGEELPVLRLRIKPGYRYFVSEEKISETHLYGIEKERGLEHHEILGSPGYFVAEIRPGEMAAFTASTERWEALEREVQEVVSSESQRLKKLISFAPDAARTGFAGRLVLAADEFVVLPASRFEEDLMARAAGEETRSIIAGYHWFTDWGRDTMISLEGLTLCTGRHREARAILMTFARYVRDGLVPNQFPEGQREAIYNTVDATLWYFHALDRYYQTTGDRDTLKALFEVLKAVIERHVGGTRFGIGIDARDGLMGAAAEGYQLTWMDAKVADWVVTPRRGKPVEIQALWYNALCLMQCWAEELGESAKYYAELAGRVHDSFNKRFWYHKGGYLSDVIDGEDPADTTRLRPNQIFAVSLRFPVLDRPLWKPVVDIVEEKLLTPYGLRTLAPGEKDYRPCYEGDRWARDAAYHQGLVWPWLIGHFLDARRRVYGPSHQSRAFLGAFEEHLRDAGIGMISEIFDAEPPYTPRGCIAQAWSVAEVLRAYLADGSESKPPSNA
jgi:predicted glycogen debranching enzyme